MSNPLINFFALLSVFTGVAGLLGRGTRDFLFAAFGVGAYLMPFALVVC